MAVQEACQRARAGTLLGKVMRHLQSADGRPECLPVQFAKAHRWQEHGMRVNLRVAIQEARQRKRGGTLLAHCARQPKAVGHSAQAQLWCMTTSSQAQQRKCPTAQGERFHASLHQPGCMRIQRGSINPNVICDLRAPPAPLPVGVLCRNAKERYVKGRSAASQCSFMRNVPVSYA